MVVSYVFIGIAFVFTIVLMKFGNPDHPRKAEIGKELALRGEIFTWVVVPFLFCFFFFPWWFALALVLLVPTLWIIIMIWVWPQIRYWYTTKVSKSNMDILMEDKSASTTDLRSMATERLFSQSSAQIGNYGTDSASGSFNENQRPRRNSSDQSLSTRFTTFG
jgi:hypothetical protein